MELKFSKLFNPNKEKAVLIVPLWNWNDVDYSSYGINPLF